MQVAFTMVSTLYHFLNRSVILIVYIIIFLQEYIQKLIDQKHTGNHQKIQQMIFMGFMEILKTNHKITMVTIQETSMFIDGLLQIQLCTSTLKIVNIIYVQSNL